MKSIRKFNKILIKKKLLQEIEKKDNEVLNLSQKLDAINRAMIELANWLEMEDVDKCSIFDVITEVRKQVGDK